MTDTEIMDLAVANVVRDDMSRADIILKHYNERVRRICYLANFWFMEKTKYSQTVEGQRSYSIPERYKNELQVWLVKGTDVEDIDIRRGIKTELIKWRGVESERMFADNTTAGKPTHYWVWDQAFFLGPDLPDGVYTIFLKWYEILEDSTDESNSNLLTQTFPKLLEDGLTSDLWGWIGDDEKSALYELKFLGSIGRRGRPATGLCAILAYERARSLSNYEGTRFKLKLR